ncbi:MlaD family protein [Ferruginibacter sp. SUN106]|uniref:MlaD family protein n=1 Tax=Ferruginibacter sp. SUN106 TaxID=2978348 RepID=UPI003D3669E1
MKISNETKIGVLTAIAITIMILGFNFLKGKTFFGKSHTFFAKYTNVQGLANSNPVMINGLQVGTVYSITTDKNMKEILVNMTLTKDVNIPVNSYATIRNNPLGTTTVEIRLGDATQYLPINDTIRTEKSAGILDEAVQEIRPVLGQVKNAVKSLDSVLMTLAGVLDPNAKNNIRGILENLSKTTAGLTVSSASLQTLLNTETGALAKSLNNVSAFTGNLANNNEKLNAVMTNLDKTTTNLSNLDLEKTLNTLNGTIGELKSTIGKLNTKDGTAGLMLNDTKLYNNLTATANKLNLLLDDLKTNPKRYISFSVFGKKYKGDALVVPLPDTVNAPYTKQK